MITSSPLVSIIVPTTASAARTPLLQRAIESIRLSSSTPVSIIAAVNGPRVEPKTLEWLRAQADVQIDYSGTPSQIAAIQRGRKLVETPYFGFLDDDDEYSNQAIDRRLQVMGQDPAIDIVVSKGVRRIGDTAQEVMKGIASIDGRALEALFELTWLCSCNGLYRSATISPSFFEQLPGRAEWTWLAFDMSQQGRRVAALTESTFVINDTPNSLSKDAEYAKAYAALFERMLGVAKDAQIRRLIQGRLSSELHDLSFKALSQGDLRGAWRSHLRSLFMPGGFRYLGYTRHILLPGPRNTRPAG